MRYCEWLLAHVFLAKQMRFYKCADRAIPLQNYCWDFKVVQVGFLKKGVGLLYRAGAQFLLKCF